MMNKEIIERFKFFQKVTGKYGGFDIEKLEFEGKEIGQIIAQFIKGGAPKYSKIKTSTIVIKSGQARGDYNKFDFTKIAYLDLNKIKNPKYLQKGDILINTTGVGTAGRVTLFDLKGNYVSDSHITTLRYNLNAINKYYLLFFFKDFGYKKLESMAEGSGGQVELSMNYVKSIKIPIPKQIDKTYTSYKIQEILVDFFEFYKEKNDARINYVNELEKQITELEKGILPLLNKQDKQIIQELNIYAENNDFDVDFSEVGFETKRIVSKNKAELIGIKRMGFTPETSTKENINWFVISDMQKNNGLYIDKPDTKEKTSIKLIEKSISKKSIKYPPIKKNDILVSFKLTVGVVKIYNSELPAYCNEAIDIISPNKNILPEYLAYYCMIEYPKYGERTNNGITLNDESKAKIKINIPKPSQGKTSLELQEIIAGYLDKYFRAIQSLKKETEKLVKFSDMHSEAIISLTFKN